MPRHPEKCKTDYWKEIMAMSKLFVAPDMRYTRTTSDGEKEYQRIAEMSRIDGLDRDVLKIELDNGDSIKITMNRGVV